jgi:hypothetical protein
MTVDDGLEYYFRLSESEAKEPLIVDKVRVEGDAAEARLAKPSTRKAGRNIILGRARFFSLENGVWYFEPYVLHNAAMSLVSGGLPTTKRAQIVDESMRKDYPGFDPGIWDGPRR